MSTPERKADYLARRIEARIIDHLSDLFDQEPAHQILADIDGFIAERNKRGEAVMRSTSDGYVYVFGCRVKVTVSEEWRPGDGARP